MDKYINFGTMLVLLMVVTMMLCPNSDATKLIEVVTDLVENQNINSLQSTIYGPSVIEWNRTYGGANYDNAQSMVQTGDGGYALAGVTGSFGNGSDCWLVKTDADGNVQWNKTCSVDASDEVNSLVQTGDGGYALAGWTGSWPDTDMQLIKTDADGNVQWNKTFGGTSQDEIWSLVQTGDGGYALAGCTISFGYNQIADFWLVKTDADGNVQWNQTYGGAASDAARSLIQTNDGGYALAGFTYSFGYHRNLLLVKTDQSGNEQWKYYGGEFGGNICTAWSVVQTNDNGYTVAGCSGNCDFLLVKTDGTGNMQWNKTYGGIGCEIAYSVVETSDGGFALAGYTESFGAGGKDFWLVKTDADGNMEWNQTFGGTEGDQSCSIVQTVDGSFVLAGYTASFGAGGSDFWLIKIRLNHNIAVTRIVSPKTVLGQGTKTRINVTVANGGGFAEICNVTLYANESQIASEELNLTSGESLTVVFMWNPTGFVKGNYTISASVDPIPDEVDTDDNDLLDGWIIVAMIGDITGPDGYPDSVCDMRDVGLVARYFGQNVPPAPANCDLTGPEAGEPDRTIDMRDVGLVSRHFGETDP